MTSHEISIHCDGNVLTILPSGKVCRVPDRKTLVTSLHLPELGNVPVNMIPFGTGTVINLPAAEPGVTVLVSSIALYTLNALGIIRPDVLAPATGRKHGVLLDSLANIIGVTELIGVSTGSIH